MLPLLLPAAILFDGVNVPVIVLLALAIATQSPSRRPLAVSGLVVAGSGITTSLVAMLIPPHGSIGSGGLGGLAAVGDVAVMALTTLIMPVAVSIALALLTARHWMLLVGAVTGILSVIGTFLVCLRFEHVYLSLPNVLAAALSPFIVVPGMFAVALACWGAQLTRGTPAGSEEDRT